MFGFRKKQHQELDEQKPSFPEPAADFQFALANRLASQMQQTARSRFVAAKRLESRDRKITRLTALSSAYLIALTVIPYFLVLPKMVADHVNLLSVFMAIVVLASSLLQYSRSDIVSAEQHHRSALEVNELVRELVSEPSDMSRERYLHYSRVYGTLLHKYSVNHDDLDYKIVQVERPHEYPWMTESYIRGVKREIFWAKSVPDVVLSAISIFLALLMVLYVLPSQVVPEPQPMVSPGTE